MVSRSEHAKRTGFAGLQKPRSAPSFPCMKGLISVVTAILQDGTSRGNLKSLLRLLLVLFGLVVLFLLPLMKPTAPPGARSA